MKMPGFYKNTAVVFLVLVVFTSLTAYACIKRSYLSDVLLPVHKSIIPWGVGTATDAEKGGSSLLTVNDSTYALDFNYNLRQGVDYPYVSVVLWFKDFRNPEQFIDLSNYTALTFGVLCNPHDVLTFAIITFDNRISIPNDFSTLRTPVEFFSCTDTWEQIEIDIKRMEVPKWWLSFHNIELSSREYRLDQVLGISFGPSSQSPLDTPSKVKINELTLHGRDWRYVYALCVLTVLIWGGFVLWLFRYHTRHLIANIEEKMRRNQPLISYQKLSVEPQKDREKTLLLRFIATEYANPDLSLESAISALGINRTKINEILKKELGFTFTAYLNKLRLTEAARLLSENDKASVAEIAYSVGYNNVSYFNKLFKNEYGCTPKTFKNIYQSD
jgi:AraC-like DNA-binding protein